MFYWIALKFKDDVNNVNLFYSGLLKSLTPKIYEKFNVNSAAALKLNVIDLSIETYLTNIDLCIRKLESDSNLTTNWNQYEFTTITLNDLMTTNRKEIVDPLKVISQLQEKLERLTLLYFQSLQTNDEGRRYNLQIVHRFLNHVFLNIIKPMIEYSHTLKG